MTALRWAAPRPPPGAAATMHLTEELLGAPVALGALGRAAHTVVVNPPAASSIAADAISDPTHVPVRGTKRALSRGSLLVFPRFVRTVLQVSAL